MYITLYTPYIQVDSFNGTLLFINKKKLPSHSLYSLRVILSETIFSSNLKARFLSVVLISTSRYDPISKFSLIWWLRPGLLQPLSLIPPFHNVSKKTLVPYKIPKHHSSMVLYYFQETSSFLHYSQHDVICVSCVQLIILYFHSTPARHLKRHPVSLSMFHAAIQYSARMLVCHFIAKNKKNTPLSIVFRPFLKCVLVIGVFYSNFIYNYNYT